MPLKNDKTAEAGAGQSVHELVQRAEHAITTLQPELAIKFYERAQQAAPEDTSVMDALGELLLSLGEGERAFEVFERSAKLAPDTGASKWLYLGQLQEGWHALQSFSKGAEVLRAELAALAGRQDKDQGQGHEGERGEEEAAAIRNQLCSVQCSIAELYLTDLCFEEEAEARCQAALDEAVMMDQGSPEVSQALANLRLSQQRGEEAAALMLETYRRIRACHSEDAEDADADAGVHGMEVDGEGEGGEEEGSPAPRPWGLPMPSMMFRVQTAKLLLECQSYDRRCARRAVRLLEQCKCEDDEHLETWYLLGVAYLTKSRPELRLARAHLQYALEALRRQQKEYRRNGGKGEGEGEGRGTAAAKQNEKLGGEEEEEEEETTLSDQLRIVQEQLVLVNAAEQQRAQGGEGQSDDSSSSSSSSSSDNGDDNDNDGDDGDEAAAAAACKDEGEEEGGLMAN